MKRIIIFLFFIVIPFCNCFAQTEKDPQIFYDDLINVYYKSEYISKPIESKLSDGLGMFIFDINHKISNDICCQIELFASLGQTQYLVYKSIKNNYWYIRKKTMFYEKPYTVENAEINYYYFKYIDNIDNILFSYNKETKLYDKIANIDDSVGIPDIRNVEYLIKLINDNI